MRKCHASRSPGRTGPAGRLLDPSWRVIELPNPAMRLVAPIRCRIVPLLSVAALRLPLSAGSNLLENSPFLPPNSAGGGGPGGDAAGIAQHPPGRRGDYEFSLYDTAKKQSTWAQVERARPRFCGESL